MSGSDLVDTGALGMQLAGVTLPVSGLLVLEPDGGVAFQSDTADPLVLRERIQAIGEQLLEICGRCDLPVEHEFCDGMYIRRLFIPKGTLIVGRIHRLDCVNVVEKGDIAVLTESGTKRVKAGFTVCSPRGLQKLGYANEDTVFTNIFRTDETDIDQLEELIAADTHAQLVPVLEDSTLIVEGG
jgi:hypothetical protein